MCILCVVSRSARRALAMLPWLVVPMIFLWLSSQLLPPGLRFEATSPRLACAMVLLFTLFWYEVLMPRLSAWRLCRKARMREKKKVEAFEAARRRKTATRCCRNCRGPYRDQNPGGGRFMCTYCGHVSKRPVLDVEPGPGPGPGHGGQEGMGLGLGVGFLQNGNGVSAEFQGKNGRFWDKKLLEDGVGWGGSKGQNGDWVSGYWGKNNDGGGVIGSLFFDEDRCSKKNSFGGVFVFGFRVFTTFSVSIQWLWGKICRCGSLGQDGSLDSGRKGTGKKGANVVGYQWSRGEKARRKAEGRRLARLERESWEEEERKQREEVARLVEEQRRLRCEKMEADKASKMEVEDDRDRESRREREGEKKRHEKGKDRERVTSKDKPNADGDDSKRRVWQGELDMKGGAERYDRSMSMKFEPTKSTEKSRTHGKYGNSRYQDNTRALAPYPSRGSYGSFVPSFWGKGFRSSSGSVTKFNKKPVNSGDLSRSSLSDSSNGSTISQPVTRTHSSWNRMSWAGVLGGVVDYVPAVPPRSPNASSCSSGDAHGSGFEGDTSTLQRSSKVMGTASHAPEPMGVAPISWQHLFKSPSSLSHEESIKPQQNQMYPLDIGSINITDQQELYNSTHTHARLESNIPVSIGPDTGNSLSGDPLHHPVKAPSPLNSDVSEVDLFKNPCYDPDPVTLLGPFSESLDSFSLDPISNTTSSTMGSGGSCPLKSIPVSTAVSRPGPIGSPIPKVVPLGVSDEIKPPSWCNNSIKEPNYGCGQGEWEMWRSPNPVIDELALVGDQGSWLPLLSGMNANQDEFSSSQRHMLRPCSKEKWFLDQHNSSPQVTKLSTPVENGNSFGEWEGDKDPAPVQGMENVPQGVEVAENTVITSGSSPFPQACWSKFFPSFPLASKYQ
ncbi:hypothetical protein AMTR_s00130p00083610 [Amborella trichopoda]|uniref:Uncharacterized protein n=1 Tax=Amborella trichopoda TaxID=13333 RepID=W1NPF5_AMBTC|nr:hypothetical protein AMTR_s00130p00083610 [Amborella trichopoda]